MACDASFLKHYHTPVIQFSTLHFKNEETLYYSAGPISRYSLMDCMDHDKRIILEVDVSQGGRRSLQREMSHGHSS